MKRIVDELNHTAFCEFIKRFVRAMTNSFSDRLRDARVRRGYSQTDLANLTGIAPGQVNRYEAGKNTPRPHVLAKLSASLGVHANWLRSGTGPRDTGSVTAFSNEIDVTTTKTAEGLTEIAIAMTPDMEELFSDLAEKEGLSIGEYLKKSLLERARKLQPGSNTASVDINELAKRVKELIAAEKT